MCWKCKNDLGTYMRMIWDCCIVYPFWCEILEFLEKWVGSALPPEPRLCLLGDRTVVPNVTTKTFTVVKVGIITAARILLCNWKLPRTSDLKEWNEEMMKITSFEYMLGRVSGEGKMKETWDSYWTYVNYK